MSNLRQYFGCQSTDPDIGIQSLSVNFPSPFSLYGQIYGVFVLSETSRVKKILQGKCFKNDKLYYDEKKNYVRFKKRSKIKTLYYASIYRKRILYQNFSKDIFFSVTPFSPQDVSVLLRQIKKKKKHTHVHTLYAHPTRITANTDVFLVDTDRIVSWVRSYRMPNFRAFIAL